MSSHVIDTAKWSKMTLFEQMGNIGSEVGRSMNAMRRHDQTALQGAYYRGLDLIDFTVASWSSEARRRELLRARELFATAVETNKPDPQLENYFMQFAIAARIGR
jgi:hypothetical protein